MAFLIVERALFGLLVQGRVEWINCNRQFHNDGNGDDDDDDVVVVVVDDDDDVVVVDDDDDDVVVVDDDDDDDDDVHGVGSVAFLIVERALFGLLVQSRVEWINCNRQFHNDGNGDDDDDDDVDDDVVEDDDDVVVVVDDDDDDVVVVDDDDDDDDDVDDDDDPRCWKRGLSDCRESFVRPPCSEPR